MALGHHFERFVRHGIVKDYAGIARRMVLTRARVTQITNLTLLAPEIQEELLVFCGACAASEVCERSLRGILARPVWSNQRRLWLESVCHRGLLS